MWLDKLDLGFDNWKMIFGIWFGKAALDAPKHSETQDILNEIGLFWRQSCENGRIMRWLGG